MDIDDMVNGLSDGVPAGPCLRRRREHNHLVLHFSLIYQCPGDMLTNPWCHRLLAPPAVDPGSNNLTAVLLFLAVLLCKGVSQCTPIIIDISFRGWECSGRHIALGPSSLKTS